MSAPAAPSPPLLPEPDLPLGKGVHLLTRHPAGLLALEKPTGVLAHPNPPAEIPGQAKSGESRPLLRAPYDHDLECYQLPDGKKAYLLHRLDSATSGVILLATEASLAEQIRERFARHEVSKIYQALVFGVPRTRRETWRDHLSIERRNQRLRTVAGQDGEPASCEMRLLHTFTGIPVTSLLQLEPHTGRTHQLRVQCQKRRLPIVGDATYGDFAKNRSYSKLHSQERLFLHAHRISLAFFWRGGQHHFEAESPTPAAFPSRPR
jgi:tRNA pseudouridine65 synthase